MLHIMINHIYFLKASLHLLFRIIKYSTCITPPPIVCLLLCKKSEGNPIIFPSQSITIVSSSVQAGLAA